MIMNIASRIKNMIFLALGTAGAGGVWLTGLRQSPPYSIDAHILKLLPFQECINDSISCSLLKKCDYFA